MNKKELKDILIQARENAKKTAEENAACFIAWNPGKNAKERKKQLMIELYGIDGLFFEIMKQADIKY